MAPSAGGPPDERPGDWSGERTGGRGWTSPWDDALHRLESLLHGLPEDRALPPLDELVASADLPEDFLREDDRARKLLHEAIVVRPLRHVDRVAQLRTEVELLTLEVELLVDRIAATDEPSEASDAVDRVDEVRARLEQIRRLL